VSESTSRDGVEPVETRLGPPPATSSPRDTDEPGAFLVVTKHPTRAVVGQRFRIEPNGSYTLGREPDSDIHVAADTVSRKHAIVVHCAGEVLVRDLGSANGTFRNGAPVGDMAVALEPGDDLTIGCGVRLRYFHGNNAELEQYTELFTLIHRDSLTGALVAGTFLNHLEQEFGRARRYDRPLSLIAIDVDRFKAVNDTYGHLCGDAALQRIVDVCKAGVRAEDLVGRLGGDEFAILCPETASGDAIRLAERLCSLVSRSSIEVVAGGPSFSISCSWGVASLRPEMTRPSALRNAADEAAYEAKRAGRGRVVTN